MLVHAAVGVAASGRGSTWTISVMALLITAIRSSHGGRPGVFKAACKAIAGIAAIAGKIEGMQPTKAQLQKLVVQQVEGGMVAASALAIGALLAGTDGDDDQQCAEVTSIPIRLRFHPAHAFPVITFEHSDRPPTALTRTSKAFVYRHCLMRVIAGAHQGCNI